MNEHPLLFGLDELNGEEVLKYENKIGKVLDKIDTLCWMKFHHFIHS